MKAVVKDCIFESLKLFETMRSLFADKKEIEFFI